MNEIAYHRVSDRLAERWPGRERTAERAIYAFTLLAALWARSVQDDAFISFRYSRNLANGDGLVFNAGERVEGYTNFLWTWLMSIPERLGWSTPGVSIVVTIALTLVSVRLALQLARKVLGGVAQDSEWLALMATATLVVNMSFLGYATTGLETMLQTTLLLGVAVLLVPTRDEAEPSVVGRILAGILAGAAILTRLDSVVLVGAWFAVHAWWLWRRLGQALGAVVLKGLQAGLPVLAVVVPWLVWKAGYYDSILPNTLEAKSWSNRWEPFLYGLLYLLVFLGSYLAFLLIGRYRRLKGTFPGGHVTWALTAVVAAWFLYICVVGADFMEFRFVVPVLPILALPAGWLLDHYRTPRRHLALVAILLFTSFLHRVVPTVIPYPVLTLEELAHWPDDNANSWQAFGEMLHETFPGGIDEPDQVTLGIIPAGVVPYYSELPSIDMLGLNDAWTARHGLEYPFYFAGHVRTSTVAYLQERDVNLMLGSMRDTLVDPDRESYRLSEILDVHPAGDLRNLPPYAEVLEIPTGTPNRAWRFVYLERHPKVDAAISEKGWRTLPIERICDDGDIDALAQMFAERTCPSD